MGLHEIIDEEVVGATQLSLVTASISTLICGVIGAPLALTLCKVLDRSRLRGAGSLLYAIIYTPIIFSPVVSGLGLLFFWGRKGIIGAALYDAGIKITFTTTAVIIAQVFVALPFFVASAVTTLALALALQLFTFPVGANLIAHGVYKRQREAEATAAEGADEGEDDPSPAG